MATQLSALGTREVWRCDACRLTQFQTSNHNCRRCHVPLDFAPAPLTPLPVPTPAVPMFKSLASRLADTVRSLRKRLGLSQRQLAGRMSVPRTYVSKIENEKATPTLSSLKRIAQSLGCSTFELLQLCERRRDESRAELRDDLMRDPFIAVLAPHVSALTESQRTTLLANLAVMVHSKRASA